MKIAMLVPFFYPHTGGTEKYVKDVSAVLVKKGHEVTIISNNIPKDKGAPREETYPEGFKVIRLDAINMFTYLPVSWWQFDLKMLEGFDIVHVHVPAFSFLRSVAGRIKQPLIVTYHCDATISEKYFGVSVPKWFVPVFEETNNAYARLFLPKADAIITTSESYASTSPVMKNIPHHVVPIGIFHDAIDNMQKKINLTLDKKKKNQILFLGRLAGNKGCDYLVKAMPKILAKFPDTKLVICGDGEEKQHILDIIGDLNISKSIEWLGTATFDKLVELYYTSLIYVFPSINRLEAFGIVQLEAMANYTAVVASDIPGPNSVMDAGKSGILVPKMDSDAIANAVNSLLGDPEKALEMGRQGRRLVEEKYDWAVIGDKIINIYKDAIAKKR